MKLYELLVACDNLELSDMVAVYVDNKKTITHHVDWWLTHKESYKLSVNFFNIREDGICFVSAERNS